MEKYNVRVQFGKPGATTQERLLTDIPAESHWSAIVKARSYYKALYPHEIIKGLFSSIQIDNYEKINGKF